jgi:2-oxo-4-hydroxy-4-carboxy-5-ureidoimidazoline decarboxylase
MSDDRAVQAVDFLSGTPIEASDEDAFIQAYGHLFEHSPWVVQRAWEQRPFESASALHGVFLDILEHASEDERLGLIRAHPQLADKFAIAEGLTADSVKEQASAGLDRLSPEEFRTFHELNSAYQAAHGFPFLICVRLHTKQQILAAMRARLANRTAIEVDAAINQIGLIALLRHADMDRATAS